MLRLGNNREWQSRGNWLTEVHLENCLQMMNVRVPRQSIWLLSYWFEKFIAKLHYTDIGYGHVKMLGCGKFLSVGGEFVVQQVVQVLWARPLECCTTSVASNMSYNEFSRLRTCCTTSTACCELVRWWCPLMVLYNMSVAGVCVVEFGTYGIWCEHLVCRRSNSSMTRVVNTVFTSSYTVMLYMMCSCIWLWRRHNEQSSRARHNKQKQTSGQPQRDALVSQAFFAIFCFLTTCLKTWKSSGIWQGIVREQSYLGEVFIADLSLVSISVLAE